MATRDPKIPIAIDLEEGDSVSVITWDTVLGKMDGVLGDNIEPDLTAVNSDIGRIVKTLRKWVDSQKEDE